MGAASYNRGSRSIATQVDLAIAGSGVHARNERRAVAEDRGALLARIADLESRLARSERARAILRGQLTTERQTHAV